MNITHAMSPISSRIPSATVLFFSLLLSANLIGCLKEFDNLPTAENDTNTPDVRDTDIVENDDISSATDVSEPMDSDLEKTCEVRCEDNQYCFDGGCYSPPMLALGSSHSCALIDNTIKCWGNNISGQLGTDDAKKFLIHTEPTPVEIDDTPIGIYAAGLQSCAITKDKEKNNSHQVFCWGAHSALTHVSGTDVKFDPAPEKIDDVLEDIPDFIAPENIAMSASHICTLFNGYERRVRCWGNNLKGQLGNASFTISTKPVSPLSLDTSRQLATGSEFTCSLNQNQTVSCWGNNDKGQLGQALVGKTEANVPQLIPNLANVVQIQAGFHHACALLKGKTIKCWGDNRHGQLGDDSSDNSFEPTAPNPALENVKQLALGQTFTCALVESGEVYCAGSNANGQLGRIYDDNDQSETFVKHPHLSNVHQIAAGSTHLCAVHHNNKLSCWGLNTHHQVSVDLDEQFYIPVPIAL